MAPPSVKQELRDLYSDTWGGTDALERALPMGAEVGAPKTVGLFYFLWQERPNDPVNGLATAKTNGRGSITRRKATPNADRV